MSRVAAIDCGTNSIRLLVAEQGPEGDLVDLHRELEIVRLGQGIDASGEFHPDALRRTFSAVDRFVTRIRSYTVSPDATRFVATSAARDARNSGEFFAGVQDRLGVRPEIITGDEEARLSFAGALLGVRTDGGPVLVMDIGGGSTELILGTGRGPADPTGGAVAGSDTITAAISLNIGSVRLTERFLTGDPPTPAQLAAATGLVDENLDSSGIDFGTVQTWIGVAGTATSMAAIQLGLDEYDRSRVDGSTMTVEELRTMAASFATSTVAELRRIPSLHPQRADVITAGSLIAARVSLRVRTATLVISESDILDGIALGLWSR